MLETYLPVYNTFTFSNYQSLAILRAYALVVDRSPVRGFEADYPILMDFLHSRLHMFHCYVVVHETLRAFQPLNKIFNIHHCIKSRSIHDVPFFEMFYVRTTRNNHPFTISSFMFSSVRYAEESWTPRAFTRDQTISLCVFTYLLFRLSIAYSLLPYGI